MQQGKGSALAASVLFLLLNGAASTTVAGFGPNGCVSVSRSAQGTCVIHTKCVGQDTADFDFTLVCVSGAKATRHSFGVGSFDDAEDYDTGVSCEKCDEPSSPVVASIRGSAKVVTKKASVAHSTVATGSSLRSQQAALAKVSTEAAASPKAVVRATPATQASLAAASPEEKANYGPYDCVSTWRSQETGTCHMQTSCAPAVDISHYEFGLLCVGQDHELTRQLFGMNSFSHAENFDTLIKCSHCLALDDPAGRLVGGHAAAGVASGHAAAGVAPGGLKQQLDEIKEDIAAFETQIVTLNKAVFTPAPVQAVPASTTTSAPPVVLAAHTVSSFGTKVSVATPAPVQAVPATATAAAPPVVLAAHAVSSFGTQVSAGKLSVITKKHPVTVVSHMETKKTKTAQPAAKLSSATKLSSPVIDSRDSEITELRKELEEERGFRKELAATISHVQAQTNTLSAKQASSAAMPVAKISPAQEVSIPIATVAAPNVAPVAAPAKMTLSPAPVAVSTLAAAAAQRVPSISALPPAVLYAAARVVAPLSSQAESSSDSANKASGTASVPEGSEEDQEDDTQSIDGTQPAPEKITLSPAPVPSISALPPAVPYAAARVAAPLSRQAESSSDSANKASGTASVPEGSEEDEESVDDIEDSMDQ